MSTGRSVFITGGTGSVGCLLVRAFAEAGYRVTFQYGSNEATAKQLSASTGAEAVKLDLAGPVSLSDRAVDILVNNAAINISDELSANVTDASWNITLAINVTAPFRLVRSVLPRMTSQTWGRVINISSIYGLRAVDGNLPYTVSKHALSGLTKTIAKEYASNGITSNEICPGAIESSMMERIASQAAISEGGTAEDYLNSVRDSIPAKRLAEPRDIASVALFLASDAADYINGVSIPVDGGQIA